MRHHRPDWEQRFHVVDLGLFGSLARSTARHQSDIDLWVRLDPLTPYALVLSGLLQVLNRAQRHWPGVLQQQSPSIDWKGSMGFRDVIAHQYFDLDVEQIMVIGEQSLPDLLLAVQKLFNS